MTSATYTRGHLLFVRDRIAQLVLNEIDGRESINYARRIAADYDMLDWFDFLLLTRDCRAHVAGPRVVVLNAEHRELILLAARGMSVANAQNNVLASQTNCYGGFFTAFRRLIETLFPVEVANRVIDADLNIGEWDTYDDQIRAFCEDEGLCVVEYTK